MNSSPEKYEENFCERRQKIDRGKEIKSQTIVALKHGTRLAVSRAHQEPHNLQPSARVTATIKVKNVQQFSFSLNLLVECAVRSFRNGKVLCDCDISCAVHVKRFIVSTALCE
jgi:hypothetical protein